MQKPIFCFVFFLVAGSLGLQWAVGAQQPVAFQLPAASVPAANLTSKPSATKLVRIYSGAGYFDDVLAERLRPMLAQAFPSSKPSPAPSVPGAAITAPATPESQKKLGAAHL